MLVQKICQHCHRAKISRPRGLCWICYYRDGVRALYAPRTRYPSRSPADCCRQSVLPAYPTRALPGSPEKLAVLIERASLQQALFHPADATTDFSAAEWLTDEVEA